MTPRQIEQAIYDQAIQQGALVIPGSWFKPNREIENNPEVFFRLSFAPPSTPEMEQVIRRLGVALRICFNLD
jgi:aromatic amino acid aminotransferase I